MIRRRLFCFATLLVCLLAGTCSAADTGINVEIYETEWTWDNSSIAAFEGTVGSEEALPDEILMKLTFTATPDSADPGEVVFTSVNDKKLTLRKQKPEYSLSTEGLNSIVFTGGWKTPENTVFTNVEITLQIYSGDGTTLLAEQKMTVSREASSLEAKDDGKFRLKEDFTGWTTIIAIAASAVWVLALLRVIINRRRR